MAEARCPDCGAPISPGAVVCPQCGFPIRPHALQRRGIGRVGASSSWVSVVATGAVIVAVLAFVATAAAIGIPRLKESRLRAREAEGLVALRWVYAAEQMYFSQHGRYTRDLAHLTEPARPADLSTRYVVRVAAAGTRTLCIEAVPAPGAEGEVRLVSMDADGFFYRAARCRGIPDFERAGSRGGVDQGARRIMRQVYEGIRAYRAAHGGKYPTRLADATSGVLQAAGPARFAIVLSRGDEYGTCVAAVPRDASGGLRVYSVDQDGFMHDGAICSGTAIDDFGTHDNDMPLADSVLARP